MIVVVTFAFAGGIKTDGAAPSWYYWILGGVGGVVIVTVSLIAVRELGAGGVTAATIAGQLALSVVIDRMGVLGLDERADHLGEAARHRAARARHRPDRARVKAAIASPSPPAAAPPG